MLRVKNSAFGFTLIELITVIIIVGVLATIAITQFSTGRERALGKEAQANLKLIQAAQKIYKMDYAAYYPDTPPQNNITQINDMLKLALTATNWGYSITAADANSFTVQADRVGSGGYLDCVYEIDELASEATPLVPANCPP